MTTSPGASNSTGQPPKPIDIEAPTLGDVAHNQRDEANARFHALGRTAQNGKRIMILDEAWQLLKYEAAAVAHAERLRLARAYGLSTRHDPAPPRRHFHVQTSDPRVSLPVSRTPLR